MKKIIFILLTLACSMGTITAQQQAFDVNTGDAEMDGILRDANTKGKEDINAFTNDVITRYGVPREKVEQANKTMSPGDVLMAAEVASATKKPFEEVTKKYEANKGKGWGVTAKELGIKPGSPEFHAMKKSMKAPHGNSKGKGKGKGSSVKGNAANGNVEDGKTGNGKVENENTEKGNSSKTTGKGKKK